MIISSQIISIWVLSLCLAFLAGYMANQTTRRGNE